MRVVLVLPSYRAPPDTPEAGGSVLLCFPWFPNLGPRTPVSTQRAVQQKQQEHWAVGYYLD